MNSRSQSQIECNVRVMVLHDGKIKQDKRFKNTATKRLTQGIAMFIAGDGESYARGKWRPNFLSFGTTGIDKQPTEPQGLATVNDPEAFAQLNPPEGERTRPWFYSSSLGDRGNLGNGISFWNPVYGWGIPSNPDEPVFQGELVTADDTTTIISRHPLLRADVTTDVSYERQVGLEGYSTDCILYGYSSVLWNKQFFNPENGPSIPRIAISEFGLYEGDSYPPEGLHTLLAGFRVPTVDDIIYIDPDEVMLVEWRITIRAIMPYEDVSIKEGIDKPTSIKIDAEWAGERQVQFSAFILGKSYIKDQEVTWSLMGNQSQATTLSPDGLLSVDKQEESTILYITAHSHADPNIYATTAALTRILTDYVTGISISILKIEENQFLYQATVLGTGTFDTTVTWTMTGNHSQDTNIDSNTGILTIGETEDSEDIQITATSTEDSKIKSVSALLRIDKTLGKYTVSDFSILTE